MEKSNSTLTWLGEPLHFAADGTVTTHLIDPSAEGGKREMQFTFSSWDEYNGNVNLDLETLYSDVYPEFLVDGKLDVNMIKQIHGCELTFEIKDEDVFDSETAVFDEYEEEQKIIAEKRAKEADLIEVPKVKAEKSSQKPEGPRLNIPLELIEEMKKELRREIRNELKSSLKQEILEELRKEFTLEVDHGIVDKVPDHHTIVQKARSGEVIGTFINASDAAEKTGISKSSISLCLSGKGKSAGKTYWYYIDKKTKND